jgi:excisionase family DNA binding protein
MTTMPKQPDAVMTIDELADYLKISKSTLYHLVRRGEVPGTKIGRHWRFKREAIDRWLEYGSPGGRREELNGKGS